MSNSTVEQFAAESKMSVERMLEHLKKHGINKNSGSDMLTDADKTQLSAQTVGTIRINRTKVEKTTVDGVAVERRRSRKVVVPSADEQLAAAKAAQEKAAQKAKLLLKRRFYFERSMEFKIRFFIGSNRFCCRSLRDRKSVV